MWTGSVLISAPVGDFNGALTCMIQSVAQDFGLGLRDGLYRKWLAVKQFLRPMSVAQRFLPP
jgi:hypothetical protein